jgi:hypothetical protein
MSAVLTSIDVLIPGTNIAYGKLYVPVEALPALDAMLAQDNVVALDALTAIDGFVFVPNPYIAPPLFLVVATGRDGDIQATGRDGFLVGSARDGQLTTRGGR